MGFRAACKNWRAQLEPLGRAAGKFLVVSREVGPGERVLISYLPTLNTTPATSHLMARHQRFN